MSSLSHHGIKGQRWGVRRFQNKDGTRTAAGKKRYSVEAVDVNSSRKEIKKLVSDFSKKDKEFFFGEEDWYRDYDSNGDRVAKRFVIKEGKNIVAFIDAERRNHYYSNESLNVVVGTAQSARGKGYASILSKTMVDWYEAEGYKYANMLEWNANKDNIGSRKAAEKAGFKEVLGDEDVGYRYSKNAKKELDELSKARMRVKAIDKEVSDKINSDFKKTKLSKISPNTTITPYGEGETGWNSELGFYKSMVVDHYATKWAKKNHAEDIAKYTKATSDWDSAYSKFDKKRKAKHTSIGGTMYIEGNTLILGDSSYLEHHGILGQKWGVRRFQNKDGTRTAAGKAREDRRVLKKGTTVKRTSYGMYDETYDNKKYVSTNDDDAGKWSRYIGEAKARQGAVVFENEYKLTRDVAVATGKDICKIIDSEFKNADVTKLKEDTDYAARALRQDLNNMSREERVSLNFAMQTQSGKKIVKLLKKHGYDALEDDHGKNVSKDPVIILDPEKNMKRTRVTANARYYFDYINHTSIDDSPHLSHHGIKGQRWGVRRFQNKDGTRTAAGKKREEESLKSSQEAKNVNSKIRSHINKQLSSEDLDTGKSNFDFASDLIKDPDFEKVIMPVIQDIRQTKAKYGNKEPYEFTGDEHNAYMNDISRIDNKTGELAITIGLAEKGEPHKKSTPPEGEYERVDMFRYALARYLDEHSPDGYSDEGDWIYHTSIGGTMYIEGNALILGDSSYLEHHGIRGQRWGVRRFQNRDGSLTNAGRKRLGYATKSATQAVKKAFKAGVKTGAKAVKAVKAQHKKAEDKKIEKKKEKASKTRAGVYANKDLFTAKELKELNAKFEEQDKLTMARLKKGVEIAKAVGQYAQTAKQIGDAYQSITGKNILSHITEIKSANEAKAKEEKETADKAKAEAEAAAKKAESKAMAKEALQKNIDAFKADQESNARVKDLEKQGNKTAAKTKLAEYVDRYNQDKAAQEQTKQMIKNQKLQEYIDRANQAQREKDAATLKETTDRGKQVIDVLSKGGGFNFEAPSSSPAPTPKATPSSNNLMAQIKAAQTKLKKPNKNETPAEHKEAQKKLNALEKVANEYKAAANKPGADPAEITEKLLKKNKDILDDIKHMDFSDTDYLEHYGVRGMKWGKHLMADKGGGIYDGTALGGGGGGGPMTEEERKKLEALKKKKEEEARKEQETAEKAKEIGVSVEAYKRYSIENNHLPGKSHYTKSNKLHNEASASVAAAQAAERQAHMNKAKAASLSRKVNSSHMFDSEGYHISQQRADDRNEAKRLRKEAKKLSKESRRALKKFYKKRYKADKERQKWQNSTSGKYHHMMRHYEIQNGVLFLDSSDYLSHHGVKGQKWGVRRFQNEDGTLTEKGRNHYEKKIEKLDRKQANSDNRRGALERRHPFAVTASAVLVGSAYAAMLVASAANPATIALGSAVAAAVSALGTHVDYSIAEAWEARGTKRRQKKRKEYEEMLNHDGLIVSDSTLYLEHHGIRGQRWGVRRFQNPDGTRTEAGKKHDAKLAAKAERKQAKADMKAAKAAAKAKAKDIKLTEKAENLRKREIERYEKMAVKQPRYKEAYKIMGQHAKESDRSELLQINTAANIRSVGQGIVGALVLGTFTPTPVAVAGGIAIAKAMKMANVDYARTVTTDARLEKEKRERRIKEAQSIKIEHSSGGMLIQNGTLFIDAGEPYLAHHGVKGMKWGKHLMAGKGEAGAGGGSGEDDEKLKEMAKKAGMSVAEYKQKFAGKLSGAASKIGEKISIKDKHLVINGSRSGSRGLAVGETGEKPKSFKEKAYNALGGKYKSQAAEAHKDMVYYKNDADDKARRANAQGRAANANKRSGNVREYMANKEGARELESEAKGTRLSQWDSARKANSAQWKYDHSIAGLYDRATGKYKQVHKRTKIPKMMDQYKYYYSEGPNSKLHNNGSSKAKTAKDQAKAAVWNAADHQIKAKEYNDVAYKNAAERESRLSEASYRRAAALAKQASSETSTSSRPRARKKKHTSGGSGVTVRRPGRKPVSRTKHVTKSSTGVKRRGATGTGARVR